MLTKQFASVLTVQRPSSKAGIQAVFVAVVLLDKIREVSADLGLAVETNFGGKKLQGGLSGLVFATTFHALSTGKVYTDVTTHGCYDLAFSH